MSSLPIASLSSLGSSKFTINNAKFLTSWSYNLQANTDCTICRCNLNTNSLYNQDKCIESILATGMCGHTFHKECIDPWIIKNKHCPICFTAWVNKKT